MRVPWTWLLEFVDVDLEPTPLADRLTMAGLEVEAIDEIGRDLAAVVCAELVTVAPHPNAERLTVCTIRTADGMATVVCGAANLRVGSRVAFAPADTRLPDGRRVETADVRGVASAGMLCSEAELGIGADASGLLILPEAAPIGARVGTVLGLEDTVLEVAITPNRGDCLSVVGIAREVAALTGRPLRRERMALRESADPAADLISIRIDDPDRCGRYVGRILSGVTVGPSPLWMQARLRAAGMRPVNNVVDVTNYVMLERGQPLHAFDYDRLDAKTIVIRRAAQERTFVTLDGQTRTLEADDLLITTGRIPVALAGVMGGGDSEVTADTRRILLESAWFAPAGIRRTARRLALRTEASYRFERTTDIEGVGLAADRAAALIVKHAGGSVARGRVDTYPSVRPPAPIPLRLKRIEDVLGVTVPRAEVVQRLKGLGASVAPATAGALNVTPPSYRSDLTREIDLIEEIVRVGGYENVPTTVPECVLSGAHEVPARRRAAELTRFLAAVGLWEAVPWSFCSPRLNALFPGLGVARMPVAVLNPVTQDDCELRMSLGSGLLRAVRENLAQGARDVALFAVGKVFWREADIAEGLRVAAAVCRNFALRELDRDTVATFDDIKGVVESVLEFLGVGGARWTTATDVQAYHPGKTARVWLGDQLVGVVGALHPAVEEEFDVDGPCWLFELDLDQVLHYEARRIAFKELPRFPAVVRDVAVVVDAAFASDDLVQFVRTWRRGADVIERVELFDQYVGPPIADGRKSLAYSIAYRAADRTLTDAEVNDLHGALLAALRDALPVEMR